MGVGFDLLSKVVIGQGGGRSYLRVRLKAHPYVPNAKLSNLKDFPYQTYQDWSRKIRMYGNPKAELHAKSENS